MRVAIMAVMLTLALAAPVRAVPITTLEFSGVLTSVSPAVAAFVAPGLTVGNPFSISIGFEEFAGTNPPPVSFSLGNVITGQSYLCAFCSPTTLLAQMPAMTFYIFSGPFSMPPTTVQWPPSSPRTMPVSGGQQSLLTLTLAQGWQSGSMFIFPENAFSGGPVTGTVTSVARVPEPATALMLGLGAAFVVTRFRKRAAA